MAEEKINNLFLNIREIIFRRIQEKHINIDVLSFDLGISRKKFIENFTQRINDLSFYFETLHLVENWEE